MNVSIFTHTVCGPCDDYLKWPFQGEITIQLVSQTGDHDHVEEIFEYDDDTPEEKVSMIDKRSKGWGNVEFICRTRRNMARYLKD